MKKSKWDSFGETANLGAIIVFCIVMSPLFLICGFFWIIGKIGQKLIK